MEQRIREIYNCEKIEGNDPLVQWYNAVIEKHVDELTISDVARCIRQNIFIESAYEVLLAYLLQNPYEGDVYEGELMDKAGKVDKNIIIKYKETILEIINIAQEFIKTYDWICEEDKEEYMDAVNRLALIVK